MRKRNPNQKLDDEAQLALAAAVANGKMIKQAAAEVGISLGRAYDIVKKHYTLRWVPLEARTEE